VHVVRYVDVSHQQIVVADGRQHAAALGAPMDGDEFADFIAAADAGGGALAVILEILRREADRGIGEKKIVLADFDGSFHHDVTLDESAGGDLHIRSNDRIGTDFSGRIDTCGGVYDGGRMNR